MVLIRPAPLSSFAVIPPASGDHSSCFPRQPRQDALLDPSGCRRAKHGDDLLEHRRLSPFCRPSASVAGASWDELVELARLRQVGEDDGHLSARPSLPQRIARIHDDFDRPGSKREPSLLDVAMAAVGGAAVADGDDSNDDGLLAEALPRAAVDDDPTVDDDLAVVVFPLSMAMGGVDDVGEGDVGADVDRAGDADADRVCSVQVRDSGDGEDAVSVGRPRRMRRIWLEACGDELRDGLPVDVGDDAGAEDELDRRRISVACDLKTAG